MNDPTTAPVAHLLAMLALVFGLGGCTVAPDLWKRAEELCGHAGGVRYLYDFSIGGRAGTAKCKDGTAISIKVEKGSYD